VGSDFYSIFVADMDYTLNCNGRLLSLAEPQVMGILNVTPDSFYADSRQQTEEAIAHRVEEILSQGGTMIDVGACSTRPDSTPVNEEEEKRRLRQALTVVRREVPQAIVSVDTFRPAVARMAVEDYSVDIINDVGNTALSTLHSALKTDSALSTQHTAQDMFRMVSSLHVPYIFMSRKPTMREILLDCAEAVDQLRMLGQKDIILDPGFGFGKTLEQNYELIGQLERMQQVELPVLVGVSRKSMIYRLLGTDPSQALNGTSVLNTIALLKGASILRVHDVRETVEAVKIVKQLKR